VTAVERLRDRGILRLGSTARGFRYRSASGDPIAPAEKARIERLAIPPAWTDVRISASDRSFLQAVGKDRAGRWQYRYSEAQTRLREKRKLERLQAFLRALPRLRAQVARDLRLSGLPRERVLAGIVRILLRGFLRPGSQVYARENGTFGVATLRSRHVRLQKDTLTFRYPGKGGKIQMQCVEDREVARLVRALLHEPGREFFRYRAPDGRWADLRRRHINEYIRLVTGGGFTAKDFRTWAGSLIGACALARTGYPSPSSKRAIRSRIQAAMRETADALGNTPAVCRASYVCDGILEAFERGVLIAEPLTVEQLVRASSKTLAILEGRISRLLGGADGHARASRGRPA
jgi:DNA topoisomerase I